MYHFKLKIRSFPPKKIQKISTIKSQETEITMLIAFSLVNMNTKAIFSYLV